MTRSIFVGTAMFVLLAAIVSTPSVAEEIAWNTDIRSALQSARAANRPLLLFVTSSHCPYCRKMESNTLSTPTVARRVQDSFVPLLVNADESSAIAAQLKVSGVPTTLVVLPDGQIADRVEGYVSPAKLQARLDSVVRQIEGR